MPKQGSVCKFGPRAFEKHAFVSRRIGVPVPSRCCGLRFGDFRRHLPPRRRDLNGSLDSGSPRAFKCDAIGFQRTVAHARNSRPTRETRAPAGMTGRGNAGVKQKTEGRPQRLGFDSAMDWFQHRPLSKNTVPAVVIPPPVKFHSTRMHVFQRLSSRQSSFKAVLAEDRIPGNSRGFRVTNPAD